MSVTRGCCFDDPEFGLDMMDEDLGCFPDECGFPSPPPEVNDVVLNVSLPPVRDGSFPVLPEVQTPDVPLAMRDVEPVAASRDSKRRRLLGKQSDATVPRVQVAESSAPLVAQSSSWDEVSNPSDISKFAPRVTWGPVQDAWEDASPRARYRLVHRRFFNWIDVVHQFARRISPLDLEHQDSEIQMMAIEPKVSKETVAKLVPYFCRVTSAPGFVRDFSEEQWRYAPSPKRVQTRSLMLTYNGSWGLFTDLFRGRSEPFALKVEDILPVLKTHPEVEQLCASAIEHVVQMAKSYGAQGHALSLEICPNTLVSGDVRVHLHVFCSTPITCLKMLILTSFIVSRARGVTRQSGSDGVTED